MDGFLGEIRLIAFDFAPSGWAFCHGQLLNINQNQALFSVLGTTYGGNGTTTFALPDYRGRTPMGFGINASQTVNYTIGQQAGSLTNKLTVPQLPAHSHPVTYSITTLGSTLPADTDTPKDHYFAGDGSVRWDNQQDGVIMAYNVSLDTAGTMGNTPIMNMMPYLPLHYIICLLGTFPNP